MLPNCLTGQERTPRFKVSDYNKAAPVGASGQMVNQNLSSQAAWTRAWSALVVAIVRQAAVPIVDTGWCTQTNFRGGFPAEVWARVDARGVGIYGLGYRLAKDYAREGGCVWPPPH